MENAVLEFVTVFQVARLFQIFHSSLGYLGENCTDIDSTYTTGSEISTANALDSSSGKNSTNVALAVSLSTLLVVVIATLVAGLIIFVYYRRKKRQATNSPQEVPLDVVVKRE